jgi:hypothetical protein
MQLPTQHWLFMPVPHFPALPDRLDPIVSDVTVEVTVKTVEPIMRIDVHAHHWTEDYLDRPQRRPWHPRAERQRPARH